MHQESDWRGYTLPEDLKESVLFTRTQLLQLLNRKRELDEEYVSLKKQRIDFQKEMNLKRKEIKENEKKKEEKKKDYEDKQMLRFGDHVDLDNLEVSGPSGTVMDL